ncbi:MAG: BamA/TamA family outer membrane protein [Armatimonadetes bacterium]|nr:BamA/TamA family outer membrane protein [Armatimonadota bacterium]
MFDTLRISATVCFAAFPLIFAATANAQEGQIVSEVEIRGTVKTAPQVASTAAAGAGIKTGEPFTADAFTEARQRIRDIGLYGSAFGRTETTPDGKLRVIFEVIENPVVQQIVIQGNKSLTQKILSEKLQTKAGDVLNVQTLKQDLDRIQQEYQSRGFAAFVTNDVGIDPKTGILLIPIEETVVESIEFDGLKKTKRSVVLREMRTKIGEPFNKNTIQRDLQRVLNLGLFSNVQSYRPEDGSDLGQVRLVIPVEEQRTGQVGVSVGYSVRQRLTGTLSLNENNFQGRGQTLNASWTVGGVTAANQFDLGFTEPWIDKRNTSASINVYSRLSFRFNRALSDNLTSGTNTDQYYEERRGGALTLARPLSDFTRIFASVRSENVRANNLQANYDQLSVAEINNIRGSLVSRGNVSSVTFRGVNNTRDSEQDPASGVFISPALEFGAGNYLYEDPTANPAFIDDATTPGVPRALVNTRSQNGTFAKANIDIRNYFPFGGKRSLDNLRQPKTVFATRLLIGTSTGNIGFSEQYFLGGADTLRGYNDDRFWGNNTFLFSNEYRFPLDKRAGTLSGVFFVDVGDAWGSNGFNRENITGFEQHNSFSPRVGFGFGVRVKTPVGPVRLDYGIGETNRTHFSIAQTF